MDLRDRVLKFMFKKGFTLIELLVVISIIGILTTIGFVSFTSVQKSARDAGRKSDIKGYQSALEVFANKFNGLYPSRSSVVVVSTALCTDLGLSTCPEDPRVTQTGVPYGYVSNGSGSGSSTATEYVIFAALESKTNYFVSCSNGKTGELPNTTSITSSTCPL